MFGEQLTGGQAAIVTIFSILMVFLILLLLNIKKRAA